METDLTKQDPIKDAIRGLLSLLDRVAYILLGGIFQVFFNVASYNFLSDQTFFDFFNRIQLIIGVFMMFQLAMIFLRGVVNPDNFTDSKSGAGNIISRIAIALILLTLLVPIGIEKPKNEFEKQINTNGILFGTLYSLQYRILSQNTIGKIVLGSKSDFDVSLDPANTSSGEGLEKMSNVLSSSIIKVFYKINLKEYKDRPVHREGYSDDVFRDNRVCKHISNDIITEYEKEDSDPFKIIGWVNEKCDNTYYVFAYTPVISAIVPIILFIVILGFVIDVVVRMAKLAILRLIAPIPIISYIDPKGSKDSSFNTWVKTLTSTYLSLFVRLAIIFFIVFLVNEILVSGIAIQQADGVVGAISFVLIIIGLFVFAKQAPKFLRSLFNMKDDDGGFFKSLGVIGAAATGFATIPGNMAAYYTAAKLENEQLHPNQPNLNKARNVASAIFGGAVGGLGATGKVLASKDPSMKNAYQALSQRNAARMAHQTGFRQLKDALYATSHGTSLSAKGNRTVESTKKAGELLAKLEKEAESNALKFADYGEAKDSTGIMRQFNYSEFEKAYNRADKDGNFTYNGSSYNTSNFGGGFFAELKKSQTSRYVEGKAHVAAGATKTYATLINGNEEIGIIMNDLRSAMATADEEVVKKFDPYKYDKIGEAKKEANEYVSKIASGSGKDAMRQAIENANTTSKNNK